MGIDADHGEELEGVRDPVSNDKLSRPFFSLEEFPGTRFRVHRLSYDPILLQWDVCFLTQNERETLYYHLLRQKPIRGRVMLSHHFMLGHWTPLLVDLHRAVFRSEKNMRMSDPGEQCYFPV